MYVLVGVKSSVTTPINGVKTSVLRESKDTTEPVKQHSRMMTPFTMSKDDDCHLPDT